MTIEIEKTSELDLLGFVFFRRINKYHEYQNIKKYILNKKTSLESEETCLINHTRQLASYYENIAEQNSPDHEEIALKSFIDSLLDEEKLQAILPF